MSKLNLEQKDLYKRVDEILWYDWDPIGVNTTALRDEYENYLPQIFSMLIQNMSVKAIAAKLYSIENETMGLNASMEVCIKIAKKLVEEKRKLIEPV